MKLSFINIPQTCPICGGETKIVKENDSEVLVCANPDCQGKLLYKLSHFPNRDAVKDAIVNHGGKVVGSVSAKVDYLVNNDINSTSSKNKKAKDLGVKIITENELIKMLGD